MSGSSKHAAQLTRMEAARRQTQHQLDLIDRQIRRRMTGSFRCSAGVSRATATETRLHQALSSNAIAPISRR